MTHYYAMTKMKYIALLAILPIFATIIVANNIGTSDAAVAKGSPGLLAPGSFGAATAGIVCGDRLCSDSTPVAPMPMTITVVEEDSMPDYMPSLGLKSLSKFMSDSPNTYSVAFTVTAAEKNLENIKIICKTDVETIETTVARLAALTTTTNVVRILAMDPASITGEIISFQIAEGDFGFFEQLTELAKVPESPTAELSLQQIFEPQETRSFPGETTKGFVPMSPEDDATTYKVVYRVSNAVDSNVRDVMILVSSDVETVVGELQGDLEIKRSAISVMIKAFDPASITAEIIGYDFR